MSNISSSWIKRFCSLEGNQFLCEVDREYVLDRFNLTGLDEQITFYKEALRIILNDPKDDCFMDQLLNDDNDSSSSQSNRSIQILSSTELLYGLIHARYILTDAGLQKMKSKYSNNEFGCCTRYFCERAAMLPVGLNDEPRACSVRLYCPRCCDIYVPHLSNSSKYISIDGAYFGTNFPHMFFMVYPSCRPPKPTSQYIAKLYGFRIHASAYEFQENKSISAQKAKQCPMKLGKRSDCNGSITNNGDDKSSLKITLSNRMSYLSNL